MKKRKIRKIKSILYQNDEKKEKTTQKTSFTRRGYTINGGKHGSEHTDKHDKSVNKYGKDHNKHGAKHSVYPRSPIINNHTGNHVHQPNQLFIQDQLRFDDFSSSFPKNPRQTTNSQPTTVSPSSIFTSDHRQLYQQVNIILSVFLIVLSTLGIICSLFVIGCWIHRKIKRKSQKLEHSEILKQEEAQQLSFAKSRQNSGQQYTGQLNTTSAPNTRQNSGNTTSQHAGNNSFAAALFLYQQKRPLSNLVVPLGCIIIYASCIMLILSNLDCEVCRLLTIWCLTFGFNLVYGKLVYDSFLLRDFLRNRQFQMRESLKFMNYLKNDAETEDFSRNNTLAQTVQNKTPSRNNTLNNTLKNAEYNTLKNTLNNTPNRSKRLETSFKQTNEKMDYGMANVANSPFRSLVTSPVTKVRKASSSSSVAPQATSSGDESDETALKLLSSNLRPKSIKNRLPTVFKIYFYNLSEKLVFFTRFARFNLRT